MRTSASCSAPLIHFSGLRAELGVSAESSQQWYGKGMEEGGTRRGWEETGS